MRVVVHYVLGGLLLLAYGVEVCPYLDSLTPLQLAAPLAGALVVQGALRPLLHRRLVEAAVLEVRVARTLALDLGLFLAGGLGVGVVNAALHGFPAGSALKVLAGFGMVGFFVGLDTALAAERSVAGRLQAEGRSLAVGPRFFPVSAKLATFAAITAGLVTLLLFLVVAKDMAWLAEVEGRAGMASARLAMLGEFLFVALAVLGYVINTVRAYSRNLGRLLDQEAAVLARADMGDYEGRVAAATDDEFGAIARDTNRMLAAIAQRTVQLERTQDVTIVGLAGLAETRDNETGAHILRTQRYVRTLAEHMAADPAYRDRLDEETIDLLFKSAPLHDVGKVGIPDAILHKPGRLSAAEFAVMKEHAALGASALRSAEAQLAGEEGTFLGLAREIAGTHHEKWDGSGYPEGLAGETIPLSGRLMAVADVYDALISRRVYKPAFSHEEARRIILEGRGSHFDPAVVDAFLAVEDRFREIAAAHADATTNGTAAVEGEIGAGPGDAAPGAGGG